MLPPRGAEAHPEGGHLGALRLPGVKLNPVPGAASGTKSEERQGRGNGADDRAIRFPRSASETSADTAAISPPLRSRDRRRIRHHAGPKSNHLRLRQNKRVFPSPRKVKEIKLAPKSCGLRASGHYKIGGKSISSGFSCEGEAGEERGWMGGARSCRVRVHRAAPRVYRGAVRGKAGGRGILIYTNGEAFAEQEEIKSNLYSVHVCMLACLPVCVYVCLLVCLYVCL